MTSYKNTQLEEFTPYFEPIPGVNESPLDFNRLKNKPDGLTNFTMDIWSSAGATGDGTFREVNLIGVNGDIETTYSQEIIVGRGSTTAKITRKDNIGITGNTFTLAPGKALRVTSYFSSSTQSVRLSITGSYRWLRGGSTDLSSTNPEAGIIATGTGATVKLLFATSASDRPIFSFLMEVF